MYCDHNGESSSVVPYAQQQFSHNSMVLHKTDMLIRMFYLLIYLWNDHLSPAAATDVINISPIQHF
jgi:hypothetical protein